MSNAVLKTPVAGFVGKPNSRREDKLKREEEELNALIQKELGASNEVEEKPTEENKEEPKPDNEGQVEETVQEEEKEELTPEEKTFKKRYGDLRAHAAKQKKELEDRIAELEKAKPTVEVPETDEELEAFRKKYPDFAGVLEKLAKEIAEQRFKEAKISIDQIQEDRKTARQEKAKREIKESHPDFDDLQASDSFHDWVSEQSKWIQDALYENEDDPKAVVRVLDLYRIDNPKKKPKKALVDAASEVTTKGRTNVNAKADDFEYTESQVSRMSDKEYAQHATKIDEAIRSGKFKYDLSGAAR